MAEEAKLSESAPAPQLTQFPTDSSGLTTVYTNFTRVTIAPEELVLDFGLNTTMAPNPNEPIRLTHRVVMNFFAAKRLMSALIGVVGQLEKAYGPIEENFQKQARRKNPK
jgi:hypothetical protein